MEQNLLVYNTLTRQKELFRPLNAPHVGMYVCGPTVYGDAHLGHARPAITFDIVFRYLQHLGYKVRYVRNITDVGHLEHDADEGEDKIAKKARLEQLEPMEVAQYYTNRFHDAMAALNVLPPSIEPHATGHIIEQEQLVQEILDNGFAYESNGSVYFDVEAYNKKHKYGILSGRNLDDIINNNKWDNYKGQIKTLGLITGDDPAANYVQLGTTQWGSFTEADYKAMVKDMFNETIKVSNDINAEPAVTNVNVEWLGNLK